MRGCIVFNPTARGNKARHLQRALDEISRQCELLPTTGPATAGPIAAEACRRGFDTIIAAGGDGTVNEVADGIASVPGALDQVRLGVIPLGTINVFARELDIPRRLHAAWENILAGAESRVDLPQAEFVTDSGPARRHFVQLAGAGLDARATAGVDWNLKRRFGPLAYVVSTLQALRGPQPKVTVEIGGNTAEGELVLLGNGRLYGGDVGVFPEANWRDGLLEVRVFPRVTLLTLVRFGIAWLARKPLGRSVAQSWRGPRAALSSPGPMPVQLDGDAVGALPATFTVRREALRVITPPRSGRPA